MRIINILAVLFLSLSLLYSEEKPKKPLIILEGKPKPQLNNLKVPPDIDLMLNSTDYLLRRQGILKLSETRDLRYANVIEKYLDDENKLVKMTAIESLGVLRNQSSSDKIVDILSKTDDDDIKNSSIIALSYMPELKNPQVLINLALKDKSEYIRVSAIRILGSFNIKDIEDDMIDIVKSEKTTTILKVSAINYLGSIKSQKSKDIIAKMINCEDKLIKLNSIKAAGDIGDVSFRELLRARVGENDADIQIESANSLAKMGDDFGLEKIYKYLDSDNINYKNMVLNIIGAVGNERSISILDEKIKNEKNAQIKSFMEFTKEKIKARLKIKTSK